MFVRIKEFSNSHEVSISIIMVTLRGVAVRKRMKNTQMDSRRLHRGRIATTINTAAMDRNENNTDLVVAAYRAIPAGSIIRHT
jgi:hypothetical protein